MSESIGRIVRLSHFPFRRFHVTRLLCLVFLALALWKHTFETSLRTLRMILFSKFRVETEINVGLGQVAKAKQKHFGNERDR